MKNKIHKITMMDYVEELIEILDLHYLRSLDKYTHVLDDIDLQETGCGIKECVLQTMIDRTNDNRKYTNNSACLIMSHILNELLETGYEPSILTKLEIKFLKKPRGKFGSRILLGRDAENSESEKLVHMSVGPGNRMVFNFPELVGRFFAELGLWYFESKED